MNEFRDIINSVKYLTEDKISQSKYAAELGVADMRPTPMDVTWEAWLQRISLWGKIKIDYYDPLMSKKYEVSQKKMVSIITDDKLMNSFGQWEIDWPDFTRVDIARTFIGINGKKQTEKFIVKVDLHPKLKKATAWWKFW